MASELSTFEVGGIVFPLPAATTNRTLQDADPAVYQMSLYFKSVLQTYMGARWSAECTAMGLTAMAANVVSTVVPYDAARYLKNVQYVFPLLSIYSRSAKYSDLTANWYHRERVIGCDFIVSPLTAGQAERIVPMLTALPDIIENRITQGFDPAYASSQEIWQTAGIEELGTTSVSWGEWSASDGLPFVGVQMTLYLKERQKTPPGAFDPLAGVDASLDLKAPDGTTIADIVDFKL